MLLSISQCYMKKAWFIILISMCGLLLSSARIKAQALQGLKNRISSTASSMSNSGEGGKSDSLIVPKKREVINLKIHYRYLNDVINRAIDSSINNFNHYLPLPANYLYLGNLGTAAHPIVYKPKLFIGFDAGFHTKDVYGFDIDSTRFYNTTAPYTRLRYLIGPQKEQLIEVLLTENLRPNL